MHSPCSETGMQVRRLQQAACLKAGLSPRQFAAVGAAPSGIALHRRFVTFKPKSQSLGRPRLLSDADLKALLLPSTMATCRLDCSE